MRSNRILPYPEGTACAEVLLAAGDGAGEGGSRGISAGMGISALAKLLTDGLGIVPGTVAAKIGALQTEFSAEAYPSLVGVVAAGGVFGLVGILLALAAVAGLGGRLDLSARLSTGPIGGVGLLLLLSALVLWYARGRKQ